MADMHHEISIAAAPEKVYEALTAEEGLRSWWTADSVAESTVGSIAEFGFMNRGTVFRMRVDELVPGKRVVWSCLGDPEEWKDTKLVWDITHENGKSTLQFTHGDWRQVTRVFAFCNSTWGALMHRLKDYGEGKDPGPLFTE